MKLTPNTVKIIKNLIKLIISFEDNKKILDIANEDKNLSPESKDILTILVCEIKEKLDEEDFEYLRNEISFEKIMKSNKNACNEIDKLVDKLKMLVEDKTIPTGDSLGYCGTYAYNKYFFINHHENYSIFSQTLGLLKANYGKLVYYDSILDDSANIQNRLIGANIGLCVKQGKLYDFLKIYGSILTEIKKINENILEPNYSNDRLILNKISSFHFFEDYDGYPNYPRFSNNALGSPQWCDEVKLFLHRELKK